MKAYFYMLMLCIFATLNLNAQTVWLGTADSDWQNSSNWSAGVPTSGMTITIPGNPAGGNHPTFSGGPVIDYTIQNAGELTFNSLVYNNGTIINFGGGTIINDGQFFNAGMGNFDNDGDLTVNGEFTNYGTFDHALSGEVLVANGGTFNHAGVFFKTAGPFINRGTTNNTSNMRSTNVVDNYGTLNNYNSYEAPFGSIFTNRASGTINNTSGSLFVVNGEFTNRKTINNDGEFQIQTATTGNNVSTGTITNNDMLDVSGSLVNNGTIINNSDVEIKDGGTLTNNNVVTNNGTINLTICGTLVQDGGNTIVAPVNNDGLIFLLNGNVQWTNLEFGNEYTDLSQTKPPVAGCLPGIFISLDQNGEATVSASQVDKGSYGSCGASLNSVTIDKTDYTEADLGANLVTLTVEDNLGKVSSCQSIVTILPYIPPIVAIDDADIDFDCPSDINVSTLAGARTAVASWTEPDSGTSTCVGTPSTDCSEINAIPGFMYLGEHNNSKYYCSESNGFTWTQAKSLTESHGGHLAIPNDAAENTFIQNGILADYAWLGISDHVNEGTFVNVFGQHPSYLNWNSGEPNNSGGDEDYVRILKSNGGWTDRNEHFEAEIIMEIPCTNGPPSCNDVSNNISGMTFMGEYNNSKYYVSNYSTSWNSANSSAQEYGGHLAVISDQEENDFIKNNINPSTGSIWTGLNTISSNNTFQWIDGSSVGFTNWNQNEPNENYDNNDVAARLLKSNGNWTDRPTSHYFEYVIEIPCSSGSGPVSNEIFVAQIRGPQNGDDFVIGVTEVAYEITDDCGNQEICIFEVTVDQTPSEITFDCPGDITINTEPGATSAPVTWPSVSASTDCYNDGLVVEQELGPQIGDVVRVKDGPQPVSYAAIDSCGNFAVCYFTVTVIATPSSITIAGCSGDINEEAAPGSSSVNVSWNAPTGTSDCFTGVVNVDQLEGPAPGSSFDEGTSTRIIYLVSDECGNTEICIFFVNIQSPSCPAVGTSCDDGDGSTINDQEDGNCNCAGEPVVLTVDCLDNIVVSAGQGATTAFVNWIDPVASTTCPSGVVNFLLEQGAGPGFNYPLGTSTIEYNFYDECGSFAECIFTVTVNPFSCDTDLDGDGICAADDCDDNDANLPAAQGTACDDGDANTENDVIGADGCSCSGTQIDPCDTAGGDADGDGICAANDCDDNDANLPAAQGTSCDDGDASTENDVIGADGCSCAGTPISTGPDCNDIQILPSNSTITISGLTAPITIIQVYNASWSEVFKCAGDCDANIQVISGLSPETHFVKVSFYTANWQPICSVEDYYQVTAGDPCANAGGDADGDGVCADADCDDNDASLPAAQGTACDDGDVSTENDVIGSDGCSCAGTPIGNPCANSGGDADGDGVCADNDCNDNDASLPMIAGTSCDDGDSNTNNDVIQSDGCSCAGTPVTVGPDCANIIIDANQGYISVSNLDESPISSVQIFNASWNEVFKCAGDCNPIETVSNLTPGTYYIKVALYTASWQPICAVEDYYEVTSGNGDPCAALGGDADGDGVCADLDCDDNDVNFPMVPGTSCDDGDPVTVEDAILADGCTCEGKIHNVGGTDCDNISVTPGDGSLTVDGLDGAPITSIQIFDAYWSLVYKCAGDCPASTDVIDGLGTGTYFVKVAYYTASWQLECAVENFYDVTSSTGDPNPRRILDFSVQKGPRQVELLWGSNTGLINDYFVIERSTDGDNYEELFTVDNKYENEDYNTYTMTDTDPYSGVSYYRMKYVHKDGTYIYSGRRMVLFKGDFTAFTLFPNPTSDQVYVHLKSYSGLPVTVEFFDALGRKSMERSFKAAPETPSLFDTSLLNEGAYLVTVKYEGRKLATQRLIIIKE